LAVGFGCLALAVWQYPKYSWPINNIVMIILAARGAIISLYSSDSTPEKIDSLLYINMAVLVFFGGTGFTYLIIPSLIASKQIAIIKIFWSFVGVLNIVAYLLIAIGLWKSRKILS